MFIMSVSEISCISSKSAIIYSMSGHLFYELEPNWECPVWEHNSGFWHRAWVQGLWPRERGPPSEPTGLKRQGPSFRIRGKTAKHLFGQAEKWLPSRNHWISNHSAAIGSWIVIYNPNRIVCFNLAVVSSVPAQMRVRTPPRRRGNMPFPMIS